MPNESIAHGALRLAVTGYALAFACIANAATPWSAQDYDLYSGDFKGDDKTDILFVAKDASKSSGIAISDGSGLNTLLQSWPSSYLGIQWCGGAHVAIVGDFNGDHKSDVLLQRATPGDSYLLLADANGRLTGISQTIPRSHLGLTWPRDQHTIVDGDFSGDGRDDVLLQARSPSSPSYLLLGNASGAAFSSPTVVTTNVSISRGSARLVAGRFGGAGVGLYVQATTADGINYIATAVGATTTAIAHDLASTLGSAETVTYSYDARGRLKIVTHIGGVNDGVQSQYAYDKANNRSTVVTTGSTNPPPTP